VLCQAELDGAQLSLAQHCHPDTFFIGRDPWVASPQKSGWREGDSPG